MHMEKDMLCTFDSGLKPAMLHLDGKRYNGQSCDQLKERYPHIVFKRRMSEERRKLYNREEVVHILLFQTEELKQDFIQKGGVIQRGEESWYDVRQLGIALGYCPNAVDYFVTEVLPRTRMSKEQRVKEGIKSARVVTGAISFITSVELLKSAIDFLYERYNAPIIKVFFNEEINPFEVKLATGQWLQHPLDFSNIVEKTNYHFYKMEHNARTNEYALYMERWHRS